MGTWGDGPFDEAADWVWDLQEADGWSFVETALRGLADVGHEEYLEAPDGQVAWAAAAVVAATVGDAPACVSSDRAGAGGELRARRALERGGRRGGVACERREAGGRARIASVR
jgi:Domain of unknown function (DUF4259)